MKTIFRKFLKNFKRLALMTYLLLKYKGCFILITILYTNLHKYCKHLQSGLPLHSVTQG